MSIVKNENTITKAFYGSKPIYMFDNGEAKYNEGFEEGYESGYQEGLESGYQNGFDNGVIEQKKLLSSIEITENGTYTKENGYNEVVVNVTTGGGSGKINVKELGIKLGNSTFSEVPKNFDWTGIKDMSFMFANCDNLTTFSQIDTSEVTTMRSMFEGCDNLVSISQLYAGNVTDVNAPFGLFGISSLTDIGGFINLKASWSGTGSFKDLPNLNYQSCINILNGLYDFTGNGETPTSSQGKLQVHQNFLDLVGLNTISELATAKGWTISA